MPTKDHKSNRFEVDNATIDNATIDQVRRHRAAVEAQAAAAGVELSPMDIGRAERHFWDAKYGVVVR